MTLTRSCCKRPIGNCSLARSLSLQFSKFFLQFSLTATIYIYIYINTTMATDVSPLKSTNDILESLNASKIWMSFFCPFSRAATPGRSGKNRSMREQLYWGLSTDFQRDLRPCFYWVIPGLTLCCPEATPVKWKHCDLICSLELAQFEERLEYFALGMYNCWSFISTNELGLKWKSVKPEQLRTAQDRSPRWRKTHSVAPFFQRWVGRMWLLLNLSCSASQHGHNLFGDIGIFSKCDL